MLCTRIHRELIGISSVLLAAIVATITYYPGLGEAWKVTLLAACLIVLYTPATLESRSEATSCILLAASTILLVIYPILPATYPILLALLLLLSISLRGSGSTSTLSASIIMITSSPWISLIAAIAPIPLILERRKAHMALLPLGFLLSGFLVYRGMDMQASFVALASAAALTLYASRGFAICPFRVEAKLASLGLALQAAIALISFIVTVHDVVLAVEVGSLYLYLSGLLAPRG